MIYRQFGKLDFKVSALGFGAMRLPGKDGAIDEKEATGMLHYAIDNGVNYVDTAWPYHREQSEPFVGRALKGGYRDKVKLATKQPTWLVEKKADCDKFLNEQLKRLGTDHIDFYLLHALFSSRWELVLKLDILDWALKAVKDGRIGHLGFSFHGNYDCFHKINMEVYERPTYFMETTDSPYLEQWWQYIAYGAAKKVFEDRSDIESIQLIMPEFKRQETLVLYRTINQQSRNRVATIFDYQSGSSGVNDGI